MGRATVRGRRAVKTRSISGWTLNQAHAFMNDTDKPIKRRILLIEDNPGDVRLVREALKDSGIAHELCVASNGEAAIRALGEEGEYSGTLAPELILLDLNLPKQTGHQVLVELKSDEKLRAIPVVVLTTSDSYRDIAESYRLRANCYVCKPSEYRVFAKLIQSLVHFWFTIAKLPQGPEK